MDHHKKLLHASLFSCRTPDFFMNPNSLSMQNGDECNFVIEVLLLHIQIYKQMKGKTLENISIKFNMTRSLWITKKLLLHLY